MLQKISENIRIACISCQTGDVIKSDKNVTADDDDVKRELAASDVTQSAESATNQTSEPEHDKEGLPTTATTDNVRSPEIARHGDDKMALLEVSSLGDREPGVIMSPASRAHHVFSARTCAAAPRIQRVGPLPPLHRHVTPLPVMTLSLIHI